MEQYGHAAYKDAVDPSNDDKFAVVPPGVNLRIFDAEVHGPIDGRIADYVERDASPDIAADRFHPACHSLFQPARS